MRGKTEPEGEKLCYGRPSPARLRRLLLLGLAYWPRALGGFWLKFEETIPESFAPGEAQYRATPSYWCNPLQKHYWPITREDTVLRFRVEAP